MAKLEHREHFLMTLEIFEKMLVTGTGLGGFGDSGYTRSDILDLKSQEHFLNF